MALTKISIEIRLFKIQANKAKLSGEEFETIPEIESQNLSVGDENYPDLSFPHE